MSEDLKQRIQKDMISAMRAKEKERLGTIRLLQAAVKQREIDDKITLDDTGVLAVVEKMIKQRRESAKQYEAGQRPELAAKENAEIAILEVYMPEAMSDADIDALIEKTIASQGAESMKDMGGVMAILKNELQGRADMGSVSAKVRARLA